MDRSVLKTYVRDKQAVARYVRAIEHHLKQLDAQDDAAVCHELMVKLAEDRFTLAVVGQFKRGKSSILNAIIGREILPTGVLPLTSVITILRFGPKERLMISRQGWSMEEEAPVSALQQYVTEEGNSGNRQGIKAVHVEFPSPFLRGGLELVDTPGIGSAIEANTATTYAFVPQCDAILFVTSADSPLAAVELKFLDLIRQYVRKVFFLINKMDLLAQDQQTEVLRFIADNLSRHTGISQVQLFPMSSRLALTAKMAYDTLGLAQSGLPALEASLAQFLITQRSATFLAAILDRAEGLLTPERQPEFSELRSSIKELRNQLLTPLGDTLLTPLSQPVTDQVRSSLRLPIKLIRSISIKPIQESDVLAALKARSCPVCKYLHKVLFDFLSKWQYSLASDEAVQKVFAADGGFCPLHTWQLAAVSSPQGLSLGYTALLEHLSSGLSAMAAPVDNSADLVAKFTQDSKSCRVCRLLAAGEQDCLRRLAELLAVSVSRDIYASSPGLCLPHLGRLLTAIHDAGIRHLLLNAAAQRLDDLVEDLQSFAIKNDATRRYLQNSDETAAYLRGLIQIAGLKSLCFPWRFEEV
ncbi:MAG TPA: dynamin family protein [Phycisphaerae bacterium]|nr:dynamin family protein [Phycisphaerae bacterium]